MHLAQDGTKYSEAAEDGGGDDGVSAHSYVEGSFVCASGLSCVARHRRRVVRGVVIEAYHRAPHRSSVAGRSAM